MSKWASSARQRLEAKHAGTKEEAVLARGACSTVWNVGDRVKIMKKGTQTGKTAVVKEPDWEGRIKVRMEGTPGGAPVFKSYMADELAVLFKVQSIVYPQYYLY
jgi:hypothetical protein